MQKKYISISLPFSAVLTSLLKPSSADQESSRLNLLIDVILYSADSKLPSIRATPLVVTQIVHFFSFPELAPEAASAIGFLADCDLQNPGILTRHQYILNGLTECFKTENVFLLTCAAFAISSLSKYPDTHKLLIRHPGLIVGLVESIKSGHDGRGEAISALSHLSLDPAFRVELFKADPGQYALSRALFSDGVSDAFVYFMRLCEVPGIARVIFSNTSLGLDLTLALSRYRERDQRLSKLVSRFSSSPRIPSFGKW